MSQLVVVGFNHLKNLYRDAMRRLRDLERAGQIRFEDTAVVERAEDGKALRPQRGEWHDRGRRGSRRGPWRSPGVRHAGRRDRDRGRRRPLPSGHCWTRA